MLKKIEEKKVTDKLYVLWKSVSGYRTTYHIATYSSSNGDFLERSKETKVLKRALQWFSGCDLPELQREEPQWKSVSYEEYGESPNDVVNQKE